MKIDNQNQIQASEVSESNIQQSFLNKPTRRHYTNAGVAIFVVIVLHLAAQFVFFKSENPQSEVSSAKIENEQKVEIKTSYEVKKPDIADVPAPVLPVVQPEPKKIAPSRTITKKKEPRESRAERLRRAEKILTGI